MQTFLRFAIVFLISFYSCTNNNQVHSQKAANKLINETSPYLLQHAYNPVDWHPWNEATLEKAQRENKLLIVSIGYAACHWCHVMEHESFEDSTVAAMMNEHFLPIKVDREERPDVDQIYMAAAQLVSGNGGWPLNAFALPDGRPIWAGTYFPKDRWMGILEQFADLKDKNYERLENSADQLVSGIKSLDMIEVSQPLDYSKEDVEQIALDFLRQLDLKKGGRKGAPKFPMPKGYNYLLKYGSMFNDQSALEAVQTTLEKMAHGGIYDQVGGGFARYSVDDRWFAPHFEKMLYDNGQLVSLYSDAYRMNKNPIYRHVIEQTIQFVERELMNKDGGFYSSLDADSEGEEGKFYVWTDSEIDRLITDARSNKIIKEYYNIEIEGNWEHQNNILYISQNKAAFAEKHKIQIEELDKIISSTNATLLEERNKRVRPGLDDKILTSWNALMIKGYVDAYKALGEEAYLKRAIRSTELLLENQMQDDFRLERNYKDGKASINGFLDDYALLIQTLLSIYEVTFDEKWLEISKNLTDYAIAHFYNPESKLFYYTSDLDPPLITRKTDLADDVIPGSNSTMANVLYRLGELYYNEEYISMSKQMLSNLWTNITQSRQPNFYSNWLDLQLDIFSPPYEVAIMGKNAVATAHEMMQTYHPNVVYIGANQDSQLPLLLYKYREDQTMIYVCQNKTCKLPVTEISKAMELIQ